MRCDRRGSNGKAQLQFTSSIPEAREPKAIPFAQRLTCTIDEACEATGLGRTKLYELIGAGQLATTTVGRRRLVIVHSLQALLNVSSSEVGLTKRIW
jgi:excisionase family DNA binding protein